MFLCGNYLVDGVNWESTVNERHYNITIITSFLCFKIIYADTSVR